MYGTQIRHDCRSHYTTVRNISYNLQVDTKIYIGYYYYMTVADCSPQQPGICHGNVAAVSRRSKVHKSEITDAVCAFRSTLACQALYTRSIFVGSNRFPNSLLRFLSERTSPVRLRMPLYIHLKTLVELKDTH